MSGRRACKRVNEGIDIDLHGHNELIEIDLQIRRGLKQAIAGVAPWLNAPRTGLVVIGGAADVWINVDVLLVQQPFGDVEAIPVLLAPLAQLG
jgi:hypothetical protein